MDIRKHREHLQKQEQFQKEQLQKDQLQKDERDWDDRDQDIEHGDIMWRFEKADLEQGVYSVSDPDLNRIAAILPYDRDIPIDRGGNAQLVTRDFGAENIAENYKTHPTNLSLEEAMEEGNKHIEQYNAAYILEQSLDKEQELKVFSEDDPFSEDDEDRDLDLGRGGRGR